MRFYKKKKIYYKIWIKWHTQGSSGTFPICPSAPDQKYRTDNIYRIKIVVICAIIWCVKSIDLRCCFISRFAYLPTILLFVKITFCGSDPRGKSLVLVQKNKNCFLIGTLLRKKILLLAITLNRYRVKCWHVKCKEKIYTYMRTVYVKIIFTVDVFIDSILLHNNIMIV